MREAAVPGYRLSKSRRSTKVLVTLALIGLFLGLFCAATITVVKTGLSPSAVSTYYLGKDPSVVTDDLFPASPRPIAELAEITHLHLVGGSIMLFLLCHLLALSEISENFRITVYIGSFASFILTFLTPWLVIYVSAGASVLFAPAVVSLFIMLVLATSIPIYEMWFR